MNETRTDATTEALLSTLRDVVGEPNLDYAVPPVPLTGGFFAEMVRFRLAGAPAELDRTLVARIVPSPAIGEWEATIQRAVAESGFPTPAVRLTAPETGALGRYLIVMDHLDGRPPLAGLTVATVARRIPTLVRQLPDQLARMAADLHALDAGPLSARLDALDTSVPTTTTRFVERLVADSRAIDRIDLAEAGERLLAREPTSSLRVIAHGDLHPFNVLVTADGPALIDWTVAGVAHPGFTLGFTQLVLANPPIPLPAVGRAAMSTLGGRMAARFLRTYGRLTEGTGAEVGPDELEWHRGVHALRILGELAGWDAAGARPRGHPWLLLEPVARRELGLGPP